VVAERLACERDIEDVPAKAGCHRQSRVRVETRLGLLDAALQYSMVDDWFEGLLHVSFMFLEPETSKLANISCETSSILLVSSERVRNNKSNG
jgi:hypothetical protein